MKRAPIRTQRTENTHYWVKWIIFIVLSGWPSPQKDPLAWHSLQCSPQCSSVPHQRWWDVQQGSHKTQGPRTCTRGCQRILHIKDRLRVRTLDNRGWNPAANFDLSSKYTESLAAWSFQNAWENKTQTGKLTVFSPQREMWGLFIDTPKHRREEINTLPEWIHLTFTGLWVSNS